MYSHIISAYGLMSLVLWAKLIFYEYILNPMYTAGNSSLVNEVDYFWALVQTQEIKISYMFSLVMT